MSAGAIVIIAIAASGVLMMWLRKRWLAKINIAVTNRITSLFAGWLPGFNPLMLPSKSTPPTTRAAYFKESMCEKSEPASIGPPAVYLPFPLRYTEKTAKHAICYVLIR